MVAPLALLLGWGRADPHALDVAKKKHALTIADGGRTREVRFVSEVENSLAAMGRAIKKMRKEYD